MAYDFSGLVLSGVLAEHITGFAMEAEKGGHSVARIRGTLRPEEKDEAIHKAGENQAVRVEVRGEKPLLLFCGRIARIGVNAASGTYGLELEAISETSLLDKKKRSRSFQDASMTYHQVIRQVMRAYPGSDCILEMPDRPIGSLLVQYEETDWEFIRRLASVFGEGLYPAVDREGIRFYAGLPDMPAEGLAPFRTGMRKDLEAYYRRRAEKDGAPRETDYLVFSLDSYDAAPLGSRIIQNGQELHIRKLRIEMERGLLTGHYEAQKKQGIRQRPLYPPHMAGVALEGTILESRGDKVRVHLAIDPAQDASKACWIPYSTMSASNDGSGWYCMPEAGDTVRVYFPTKYTKDAVALSSVSNYDPSGSAAGQEGPPASPMGGQGPSGGGEDRMGDPDVVFLSTIHGKEVRLSPDGIRISCSGGASAVEIGSSGEVSFCASKNIELLAEKKIEITTTGMLSMAAAEKIELACDKGGSLILDDDILMKGTEVKVD